MAPKRCKYCSNQRFKIQCSNNNGNMIPLKITRKTSSNIKQQKQAESNDNNRTKAAVFFGGRERAAPLTPIPPLLRREIYALFVSQNKHPQQNQT